MNIRDEIKIAEIQSTQDYRQFNTLAFNRGTSKAHLRELMRSYEEHPEMISASPILVNERMEVIDGQHRLIVLEKLGLPVYYIVIQGANILSAQVMNANQKPWTFLDFARSYAASGNRHYQRFLDFYEEYPIAPTALMSILLDQGAGGALTIKFKRGALQLPQDEEGIYKRLEWIYSFQNVVEGWGRRELVIALFRLMRVKGLDKDKLIEKLSENKLPICGSVSTYLAELEHRYNNGDGDRLRFT